ncbi:16125_t:CDS:1, partial [Funneliformis geosporum]
MKHVHFSNTCYQTFYLSQQSLPIPRSKDSSYPKSKSITSQHFYRFSVFIKELPEITCAHNTINTSTQLMTHKRRITKITKRPEKYISIYLTGAA